MNFIKEFIQTLFKDSLKLITCTIIFLVFWIYGMKAWNIFIDPWCPAFISAPLAVIFVVIICPLLAYSIISKIIDYIRQS